MVDAVAFERVHGANSTAIRAASAASASRQLSPSVTGWFPSNCLGSFLHRSRVVYATGHKVGIVGNSVGGRLRLGRGTLPAVAALASLVILIELCLVEIMTAV